MKKLLITGASGFLGWNLCRAAQSDWKVVGTYFSHCINATGLKSLKVDLTSFKDLKKLFKQVKPDAVIHTAAISDANYCQNNPKETSKINTEAAVNIAGFCSDLTIPCVFTSSDLVFDGRDPPYREQDAPSPVNKYGEQKVLAEVGMKRKYPAAVICRMPLMFGDAGPVAASFIQPLMKALTTGVEVNLFIDEFRTPISGKNAADGLIMALNILPDVIHLGGIERISRYEFGKLLTEVFKFPSAKIVPCRQKDHKMAAPRPPDVSLDNTKARKLGFQPEPIKTSLARLKFWDRKF